VKDSILSQMARQTVMPGSIYSHKTAESTYDISVWYFDGGVAAQAKDICVTTPRITSFNSIIRAISFATFLYVMAPEWVEGSRQAIATKVSGWLARVVRDSRAMNNHDVISQDVWCPVDDDSIVESLLDFVCKYLGDEEIHMRKRAYRDAVMKLERNPDAKIPGWPVIENTLGSEKTHALRTVFTPGSDVSVLTQLAERYIYDESNNEYVDRIRHAKGGGFSHPTEHLITRHRNDVVRVNGKVKEAFRIYEASNMRRRIDTSDLYPDLDAGGIFRLSTVGDILSDDDEDDTANVVFNTWRGWPVHPADPVDQRLMNDLIARLDKLLGYLTCDNKEQIQWIKNWIAWTMQYPGQKQQIAWVCVGEQGVGKSFFGETFMAAIMGRVWGACDPKVMEGAFSVEPFINKMFVFVDEAKFHGDTAIDGIKKLIRNINIGGAEKFQSSRTYRIFARIMFASNRLDMHIGQTGIVDRALFYTKAYTKEHMGHTELQFRNWAETLKPWFDEFAQLLKRRDVREHYVAYFASLNVTQAEVESIRHSSSTDSTIMNANMSWSRKIAKYMLEEARIYEDLDICYPFTTGDFNARVIDICKLLGFKPIQGQHVLNEFQSTDLIEKVTMSGKIYWRFVHKWGDSLDAFGAATGLNMEPQFEVTENDRGKNEATTNERLSWRGSKQYKF